MEMLLNFETLRVIWWLLLGVLLIGFAIMGGFDLGVGTLLPFAAKTDEERRAVINTVGPTWEGNQVWFILGGGAIFAAWPFVYAVSFSTYYLAMFLLLVALILRPVGFKYRSKKASKAWRRNWDWALFAGAFIPSLVFGVAVGNVLLGAPFSLNSDLRITYHEGTFSGLFKLFTPFTLLCGLLSVAMLTLQGATWLAMKIEKGVVRDRALRYGAFAAVASVVLFAIGYAMVAFTNIGYAVVGEVVNGGASNPTRVEVVPQAGAYLQNFSKYPWMWLAPILGFAGPLGALAAMRIKSDWMAFVASSAGILGIISTVGLSMFPIILPSSVDSKSSLLVWTASSSHGTLLNMLIVTVVFMPIILIYTSWVYKVLFGRVKVESLKTNPDLY